MYKACVSSHAPFALALLLLCASSAAAQIEPPITSPKPPSGDVNGDPRTRSHRIEPLRSVPDSPKSKTKDMVNVVLGQGWKALKANPPDYARADWCFRYAAVLDPKETRAYEGLGDTHEAWGQYEKAASAYERAVALKPRQAETQYKLGVVYHRLGRDEDARARSRTLRELKKQKLADKLDALLGN